MVKAKGGGWQRQQLTAVVSGSACNCSTVVKEGVLFGKKTLWG